MKNDRFPTLNMFVETIKEFLTEYMSSTYLQSNKLQRNILGYFIDNGYDIISEVHINEEQKIDLLIRLSEGFMPIEIKIGPQNQESIDKSLGNLSKIINAYKDIHSGYLICLLPSDQTIFDQKSNLLHRTNNEKIVWWGGRLIKENEDARGVIEPYWFKEKLKLYGLKRHEE